METIDVSAVKNPIETETAIDAEGRLRVGFKLRMEDYEVLKSLQNSPQWALYRSLLIKSKDEFFNNTLAVDDPHKVMKQMGMVAGINYAINSLRVLVHDYDKKQKKAVAQEEKKGKPS